MFRKKIVEDEVIGIINDKLPYNAVELKKMAQMGDDKVEL